MKDNAGASLSALSETSASADGEHSLISVQEKTDLVTMKESSPKKVVHKESEKLKGSLF